MTMVAGLPVAPVIAVSVPLAIPVSLIPASLIPVAVASADPMAMARSSESRRRQQSFGGKAEVGVSAAGAAARNLAERRCQDYGNSHRYQKGPSARDAANTLSATL